MPIIPQASSAAGRVDSVFLFIFVLCAVFLVLLTAALIYFVIKYNRKRHPRAVDIEGNKWVETVWTIVPTILFLMMFVYGWTDFRYMREVPREAMVIEVTGRQWAWSFKYPNGKQSTELILAVDKPVKLVLRSADVIHGFFIPAFRIKEDVVPGKENYTWFSPTQLGSFDIECTVICGVSHANMLGKAVVVPVDEFKEWYFGDETVPTPGRTIPTLPPEIAAHPAVNVLNQRFCLTCHSFDGSPLVGPSFKGIYATTQTVLDSKGNAREIVVDDDYLVRAIQDPAADILKGYPPSMPKTSLSEDELAQVVDFIRNLK